MADGSVQVAVVQQAVIPAAGLGTRLLPLTRVVPKELLPIGREPLIQQVVEEAVAAGITRICIVLREGKETIRDYFRPATPMERQHATLARLEQLVESCSLTFVFQPQPGGLGDALLQARGFVGTDPFVMLIPDQLLASPVGATRQLVTHWRPGPAIWSSLVRVPRAEVPYFAGARGFLFEPAPGGPVGVIHGFASEQEVAAAAAGHTYELRGFGRTVFPAAIMDYLGPAYGNPATGEVDLALTFEAYTRLAPHYGVLLDGAPLDLGTFPGYYHYAPQQWPPPD